MSGQSPPKQGFITSLTKVSRKGERRWMDSEGKRLYTWDAKHGELEVFNRRGLHLGAVDPTTGEMTKKAEKGRWIDV